MNVNSTSSSSSSSSLTGVSSSSQLTGLASGLDTDSIVEELLAGITDKINTQKAQLQQAEWKQTEYRTCITSINSLSGTYLDTTYGASTTNNMASADFFDTMTSSSSDTSAVSVVSSSSDAATGDMTISVSQLATAASVTGVDMCNTYSITGSAITSANLQSFKRTIAFDVKDASGTTTVTVDLGGLTASSDVASAINSAMSSAGFSSAVTASVKNGSLVMTPSSSTYSVSVNSTQSTTYGLQTAGMSDTTSATSSGITTLTGGSSIDTTAGMSVTVDLDGVQKEITIAPTTDASGLVTTDTLLTALNTSLKTAFGTAVQASYNSSNALVLSLSSSYQSESGHSLTIYGTNATNLGLTAGASTSFNTSQTLAQMGLSGDTFSFSINGTDFSYTSDTKVSTILSEINSSAAGVKLSYSSLADKFTLASTDTGLAHSITLSESSGTFLEALFGSNISLNSSSKSAEPTLTTGSITGTSVGTLPSSGSVSMAFTVNGTTQTYTCSDVTTFTTSGLNTWLKDTFGSDTGGNAYISYDDSTGTGVLNVTNGDYVTTDTGSLATALGLSGVNNKATSSNTLGEIVQLKDFATAQGLSSTQLSSLGTVTLTSGVTLSYSSGAFTLTNSNSSAATVTPGDYSLDGIFGTSAVTLGAKDATATISGQDAKVTINGVTTSRSSNSFTVNGIALKLTDTTSSAVTISTSRDVDTIVSGIKKFVDSYNSMLDTLYGYVDADATYLDYDPLTSTQEDDMSESQIEKWNTKAKTGLLHRDITIDSFLGSCRSLMYTKPASSNYALYQIGIETGDYKDQGKLTITESTLREALESDPDSVKKLFTDSTSGIAIKLKSLCDDYAKDSYGDAGQLVTLAGIENGSYETSNELSVQESDIQDKIDDLQDKYEKKRESLWTKMSKLETALSNSNSTMSYLSSMTS